MSKTNPASDAIAVTPSDTAFVGARSLFIGTSGDVTVMFINNDVPVTFKNVSGFLPVSVEKVMATGTTATDIVALY